MLVFLDTEFTDFLDCDLISIGMVSEDGQHRFYAERSDYRRDWESDFVRAAVLPHLRQHLDAICSRAELTRRLWQWFATVAVAVQIASDSMHDRDLLWDALEQGLPANLNPKLFELATLAETSVFKAAVARYHQQPECPWHHAFHDACAHRVGWLAWRAENAA